MARQSLLDIFSKRLTFFIKGHALPRCFYMIEKIFGKKSRPIGKTNTFSTDVNRSNAKEKERIPEEVCEKQIRKEATDLISDRAVDTTPDVLLDVPELTADELKMNVDDLNGQVALHAELADFVKINVGVTVGIKKIDFDIKKMNVKAVLKVRLKQVYAIFHRTLDALEQRPEIFKKQGQMSMQNENHIIDKTSIDSAKQKQAVSPDTNQNSRSEKKQGIINSQITFGNRNSNDIRNIVEYLKQSIYTTNIKKGEVRSHFRLDK